MNSIDKKINPVKEVIKFCIMIIASIILALNINSFVIYL